MNTMNKVVWSGILAFALCGSAFAHGPGVYGSYPDPAWAGGVTIWGDSSGYTGYSGTLSVGSGYGYVPVYAPVVSHRHGPQCYHGPRGYGHRPQYYDRGYGHGRPRGHHHGRKHKRGRY